LNEKYANSLLTFLLKQEKPVKKTSLSEVVSNPYKLTDLLLLLQKDGFINVTESKIGKKSYEISLTLKGREVAEQLRRVEEVARGKKFKFPDKFSLIMFLNKMGSSSVGEVKDEFSRAYDILTELITLKVVESKIDNTKYPPVSIVSLTEKGKKIAKYLDKIDEEMKN
jgi:DNA-binding HxlR family transcriptional regulator